MDMVMHSAPPKSRHRSGLIGMYLALMLLTLLVFLSLAAFVLDLQKNQLEREFLQQAHHAQQSLRQTFAANETILDGFTAYLSAGDEDRLDQRGVRRYVRSMLLQYKHLYMFQVARRINARQIHTLEQSLSTPELPFEVWYYDGEVSSAREQENPDKIYFPIVFAEPVFRSDISVMGLDVQSIAFINAALQQSNQTGKTALSHPFELFEGDDALVMIKPSTHAEPQSQGPYYALLVVKVDALLSSVAEIDGYTSLGLRDEEGQTILRRVAISQESNQLNMQFDYVEFIKVAGKKLELKIQRGLTLSDFNFWLPITLILMGFIVIVMLVLLMRVHLAAERKKERDKLNLYRQANYDELTGLANRHYFQAQVEISMAAAMRRGSKIGFMYLDLNEFKSINDRFWHAVGDRVLIQFSEIIFAVIRGEDIAARLGGDEFVIMLNNIRSIDDTKRVLLELRARCALVQEVAGHRVQLKTSIGTVLYPDQGKSLEELLMIADSEMYQDKNRHKTM